MHIMSDCSLSRFFVSNPRFKTVLLLALALLTTLLLNPAQAQQFGPQQVITTDISRGESVIAADLTNDGLPDVLAATRKEVTWYENLEGSFGSQQVITTNVEEAYSVQAPDLDGDGDRDVVYNSYDILAWHENKGDSFSSQNVISSSLDGSISIYTSDLNSDGDTDIITTSVSDNQTPGTISWFKNNGDGKFGPRQTLTDSVGDPWSVYAEDLNGDGDTDVIAAAQDDGEIGWFENQGNEEFSSWKVITTSADGAFSVHASDLDGDGDQDVISASGLDDKVAWYENNGDGNFGPQKVITTEGDVAYSVFASDLDGDTDKDVLSGALFDQEVAWNENQGNGDFGERKVISTSGRVTTVYAEDLDGDGDPDVLSASRVNNRLSWYENLGDGSAPPSPSELSVMPGDGEVHLTWSTGGESNPEGYNVYRSTSSFSDISNATKVNSSLISGASYTDTEVTNGTEYFYRVTAVDNDGNESAPSSEVHATPGPFADWPSPSNTPALVFKIETSGGVEASKVVLKKVIYDGDGNTQPLGQVEKSIDESFVVFESSDLSDLGNYDDPGASISRINIIGEDGGTIGHQKFKYDTKFYKREKNIDAILNVYEEEIFQPNVDRYTGWNYYEEGVHPVSMLIPPNRKIEEVGGQPPVVMVHGLSGYYPYWGYNPLQPTQTGKPSLVKKLSNNFDTWRFYYPKNQDISKSSLLLSETLQRLQQNFYEGEQKFDIVAHSMGGLVTRHYVQSNTETAQVGPDRKPYPDALTYNGNIDDFIMMGTPNHGALSAYEPAEHFVEGFLAPGFGRDPEAPAYEQLIPGSQFLQELNSLSSPGDLYPPSSTLVLAGTRNEKLTPTPTTFQEIPNQDDGLVAVSSASLLGMGISLATDDFAHSATIGKPRLTKDTGTDVLNFLTDEPLEFEGFWEGSSNGETPEPTVSPPPEFESEEGVLIVDTESVFIDKIDINSSNCGTPISFDVDACIRVGESGNLTKVPGTSRFFTHVPDEYPVIGPASLGFDAATGLENGVHTAIVQKNVPESGTFSFGDKKLIKTRYLQTSTVKLSLGNADGAVVGASSFTPATGSKGSSPATTSPDLKRSQDKEVEFQIDAATDTLSFWLAQKGSGDFSQHNMRLVSPDGTVIDSSMAKSEPELGYRQNLSVGSAIYLVPDPAPGRWTVRHDASVDAIVSAPIKSAIGLEVSMPDSSFTTEETVPVTVSVSDQNTYQNLEISAQLRVDDPDGEGDTKLGSINLSETGPATYQGEFSPSYVGSHSVAADFSAKVGGESVLRRAVETVQVIGDSTNTAPEPPSAPTSLSAQVDGKEGVTLSWEAPSESTQGYCVYRDTIPSPVRRVTSLSSGQTAYTDTSAQGGKTYYYRITAVGTDGVESDYTEETAIFTYPSSLSVDVQRSFGDASTEKGYRLVALPGAVDEPLSAAIEGEAGADWQAFWDDGSSQDYFQKYEGSGTFTFRPGRGFWVLKRSDWTVQRSVETVALSGKDQTSIPLHEGWNIISNPFGGHVPWAEVDAANSDSLRALWTFDGSFAQVDTFRSAKTGEAFYFLNDSGLDSLRVPYPSDPSTRAKQKEESSLLAISARPKGSENPTSTVKVGFDEEAAQGLERLDQPAPPGQFSAVSLRLVVPGDAPKRRRLLMTERRPPSSEPDGGHTFDLRLRSREEGPVQINASRLEAAEGSEVKLLHPSTGRSYDLRAEQTVTLENADSTALRLAVGSAAYVQEEAEKVVPDEVTLTSYPNPTAGQATLEYTLPEAKDVRLTVYDVLGRRVAVLEDGRKEAGRHRARLEADRLSSGVYFGRLRVGGQTHTQKITVVR